MDSIDNNTQAALDAGAVMCDPKYLAGERLAVIVLPKGATQVQVDLEKFQPTPARKHGTVTLATAQSFIDWVNRNKTPEAVIYAKESDTSFLAGPPGWGDYTSRYGCPLSDEWKRWHGKSQHDADPKKMTPHGDFVQFIEDNLLDIKVPANGAMLATVRAFEAKKDVKFASAVRLDNGDIGFNYVENTEQVSSSPAGKLTLPEQFTIAIPIFKGGAVYELDAKLRYRITGGGLGLYFDLVRPHKSLEHAFATVSKQIESGTNVPMFST